jgi:hypothetical protein
MGFEEVMEAMKASLQCSLDEVRSACSNHKQEVSTVDLTLLAHITAILASL